jgi:hypothetical protein
MDFYTLVDIPEGEEITISYIPLASTTPSRREYLAREYFFYCMCSRCVVDCAPTQENVLQSNSSKKKSIPNDINGNYILSSSLPSESSTTMYNSHTTQRKFKTDRTSNNPRQSPTTSQSLVDVRDEFWKKFVCPNINCEGKGLFIPTARGFQCNLCRQISKK